MGRHSRKGPGPKGSNTDGGSGAANGADPAGAVGVPGAARVQAAGDVAGSGVGVGVDAYGGAGGPGVVPAYDAGGHPVADPYQQGPQQAAGPGAYHPGHAAPGGYDQGAQHHQGAAYGYGAEHAPSGYGVPTARGGHPEQHEAGGGWGAGASAYDHGQHGQQGAPQHHAGPAQYVHPEHAAPAGPEPEAGPTGSRIPGPRREFVDAFDPAAQPSSGAAAPTVPERDGAGERVGGQAPVPRPRRGGKGRTLTGIAAAAVTTVLAVVVAGQVSAENERREEVPATGDERGDAAESASRSDDRQGGPQPHARDSKPQAPTYEQQLAARFPIDPDSTAEGTFETVPGFDKAPGPGKKVRYRVDVEKGLDMDGAFFAAAVQRTLNDERSWARKGAMSFERISSGDPDFVITLASPGTTDVWCAKSGLNTSIDKVSCDSASTSRVMINAFRWGQGSETYGEDAMVAYRQMLINHEVGHRLGHGHVSCRTEGSLAPVMQQQTKSLKIDGISCKPNPWVYPKG
ncbi:DUF3152 domain-containing protein [Streptomyces sp. NPDC017979]|uniref:DUF3152 domain-containing protein n=1 Tax=Streptomyces sp. NPDC017979 TaxID=3365024 RepID=UPI0037AF530F